MDPKKTLEKYVGASMVNRIFCWLLLGLAALQLVMGIAAGGSDGEMWFVFAVITLFFWIIPLVYVLMPTARLNKCLKRLEENGELEQAAKALESSDALVIGKNVGRISGGYLFGKHTGMVVRIQDLMWCYKFVQRVYFFTVNTSLLVCTMDHVKTPAVIFGKNDRNQELEKAMLHMQQINPNILLGFNRENAKAYKAAKKAAKS